MAYRTLCPGVTIEDPKADLSGAVKLGNVRIGQKGVYLPAFPMGAQYVPIAALERAWSQKGTLSTSGCCGVQLPMYLVRLQCAGGFYQTLSFDKEKDAERALSLLRERRPDLPGAPEGKGIGSSIL